MSILIGIGFVNILGLFTILIDYLSQFTKKYPLLLVVILLLGDALFGFSYYVVGKEFVNDLNIQTETNNKIKDGHWGKPAQQIFSDLVFNIINKHNTI